MKALQIDRVTFTELPYLEATNNSGIIRLNPEYKNQKVDSCGYDMPGFYPELLGNSDFRFPVKEGTVVYYIEELDFKNLYYGIYKCDIVSDHPDFKNIFMFSKTGYYTHYDIQFAHQHRKKFNVQITLDVTTVDSNCMLYEQTDLIDSKYLFSNWYAILLRYKKEYKKTK